MGKLSRLHRSTLWYYAERSLFASMSAAAALLEGLRGRWPAVVYVRDTVAAFWWATTLGPALAVPRDLRGPRPREHATPRAPRKRWAQGLVRGPSTGAPSRESTLVVSLTDDFRRLLADRKLRDPADVAVIPDAFDDAGIPSRRPGGGAARPRLRRRGPRSWSTPA